MQQGEDGIVLAVSGFSFFNTDLEKRPDDVPAREQGFFTGGNIKNSVMEVSVNAVKFKPTSALMDFVDKKARKIETLLPQAIKVDVTMKVDKEHDVCNKVADMRVVIPGDDLYASKQCDTFEEAIDQCLDALKKQIEKLKEKWH